MFCGRLYRQAYGMVENPGSRMSLQKMIANSCLRPDSKKNRFSESHDFTSGILPHGDVAEDFPAEKSIQMNYRQKEELCTFHFGRHPEVSGELFMMAYTVWLSDNDFPLVPGMKSEEMVNAFYRYLQTLEEPLY